MYTYILYYKTLIIYVDFVQVAIGVGHLQGSRVELFLQFALHVFEHAEHAEVEGRHHQLRLLQHHGC